MSTERQWSFSTLSLFQTCKRKYYYRKVLGLTPLTVAPALAFGKALHEGFETFYFFLGRKEEREQALEKALRVFREGYEDRIEDDKRTIANGEKLLKSYEEVYRNEGFVTLTQEVAYVVPLEYTLDGVKKSVLLCGVLDALVRWNGPLYVLERKTTAQLNINFFKPFEQSSQLDHYIVASEKVIGEKCYGAILDAAEVWKEVKRETAKTKKMEDHFARDIINRSTLELEEFAKDTGMIVEEILEAERTNRFPRNKQACFSYNYKCPYWDICKYGDDPKVIARSFEIKNAQLVQENLEEV